MLRKTFGACLDFYDVYLVYGAMITWKLGVDRLGKIVELRTYGS
jgi:hypothetical protein